MTREDLRVLLTSAVAVLDADERRADRVQVERGAWRLLHRSTRLGPVQALYAVPPTWPEGPQFVAVAPATDAVHLDYGTTPQVLAHLARHAPDRVLRDVAWQRAACREAGRLLNQQRGVARDAALTVLLPVVRGVVDAGRWTLEVA